MSARSLGPLQDLHLAKVLDNEDPDGRGRLQVQLQSTGLELWAATLTGSAGQGYGVSLLPKVDELVVVAFVSPELAVVLGALWSGASSAPEDAGPVEERYAIRTPAGSKLVFDDENGPSIAIETSSGYHITITEDSGGEVTVEKGGERIQLSSSGISITSSGEVSVEASQVSVSAGMVQVDAGMSKFSGVVKCDTLISNSVVSSSYTPGAGNIW